MHYDLDWLIDQANSGERIKYIFFWGHRPSADGSVTASCFSQWWTYHPFEHEDILYKSAEHWMMAGKARLFNDFDMLQLILECESPGEAKKLGRKVRNFDHVIWEKHRFEIVVEGNMHKFSQHDDIREFLINTGDRVIVEASPYDRIWGIGMSKNNENAPRPEKWRGLNLLGFALMVVRDRLMEAC
ncbi:MAG: NADAR family protein [Bacteroidota bacterium]